MNESTPRDTLVTAYTSPRGTITISEEPIAGQMRLLSGPLGSVEMIVKGSTDIGDVIGPVAQSANAKQAYISVQIWLQRASEIYASVENIKWHKNEARNSDLRIAAANAIQTVKLKARTQPCQVQINKPN